MTRTARAPKPAPNFYADALSRLARGGIAFLVGGAYAYAEYTGIKRDTKDLDIFCAAMNYPQLLNLLSEAGYETEVVNPTWLAKAFSGDYYVDVIWNGGNQLTPVNASWFEHARTASIFGVDVQIPDPVELIWSKIFVRSRLRHDEPDILHLLLKEGERLDWHRLLSRTEPAWELLLADLMTFWYVYPSERHIIPRWVTEKLLDDAQREMMLPPATEAVSRGDHLSKSDYQIDPEWGFVQR